MNFPTVQPPVLGIMASSPQLGAAYQATCMLTLDTELSLEEIDGTVGVQWLDSNGKCLYIYTQLMWENGETSELSLNAWGAGFLVSRTEFKP